MGLGLQSEGGEKDLRSDNNAWPGSASAEMALSSQYQKARNLSWISINRILSSHPTLSVEECCSGFCYENILRSFITGLHGCHVMTLLPRKCCGASKILDQVQLGCSCCSGHLHPAMACGLLEGETRTISAAMLSQRWQTRTSEWLTTVYFPFLIRYLYLQWLWASPCDLLGPQEAQRQLLERSCLASPCPCQRLYALDCGCPRTKFVSAREADPRN